MCIDNICFRKEVVIISRKVFDCNNYGDISVKEVKLYCLDCEDYTTQQLAYYKGDKDDKIKFCMQCGKSYCYDWEKVNKNLTD